MNRLSTFFIFIIACLLPVYFNAQTPAKKRVTLYHQSTTVNGVTSPGSGKSIIYNQFDDFDFVENLEKFGIENAGCMLPTDGFLTFKDANRSDIRYFSDMRRNDGDRIAVTYNDKDKSLLFTTSKPVETQNTTSSPSKSSAGGGFLSGAYNKLMAQGSEQSNTNQIPSRLKQLLDAKNTLEARLYAYKNNNFSFPVYGVKMTTTYNGRVSNDTPQNMTIYLIGSNDVVAMLIGENYTGVFIYHSKNSEGYDVYASYFNPNSNFKDWLYIGNGSNKDKVIYISKGTAPSGGNKTTRCEWTTEQSKSNNAHNQGVSSGSSYSAPSINNQSNYSSSSSVSTRRTCPACHGTGKGTDRIVYQPDYTGKQANVYCSKCGKYGSPHTHNEPMCRTCYGRGYIE